MAELSRRERLPTLYEKLNFNFIRDVTLARGPLVVAVNPSVPVKTIPELLAYARANPGKIAMASAGSGSVNHMAGELFKAMASIDMMHVPYRGAGPAVADLLGCLTVLVEPEMPWICGCRRIE